MTCKHTNIVITQAHNRNWFTTHCLQCNALMDFWTGNLPDGRPHLSLSLDPEADESVQWSYAMRRMAMLQTEVGEC